MAERFWDAVATIPKHEIRNPRQIQKPNVRMSKTAIVILLRTTTRRMTSGLCHLNFCHSGLSRILDFGFWISDFGFRTSDFEFLHLHMSQNRAR